MITQQYLLSILSYNEETGLLNPLSSNATNQYKSGRYIAIQVDRKPYQAHRIIWMMKTGSFPDNFIDHINGDGHDNRWSNLRAATQSQNNMNRRTPKNNKLGIKCVFYDKSKDRYVVKICKKLISRHKTLQEAIHAKEIAIQKIHKEFQYNE